MIPKRIALKNFLSFGEPTVEFSFVADEPLWVLCGANGTGKSAVFDGISYALYGEHRGSKQKAEQLIRHGANGFEVEFDFEFNRSDYRVRRTRPRKGRTTQHIQKCVDGEWKCVRGTDPAGAVTADDIKDWAIDTLGLSYEAFTNSVLLRQGEADKLFSASRDERIEVLKGIIGFEQFEALSDRVHTATAKQATVTDSLRTRLSSIQTVTDEEQTAAEASAAKSEKVRDDARKFLDAAGERVGHARHWEKLEKQRLELNRQLTEAEERQKQGRQIREDKRTLDDLTATVPVLEAVFVLRDQIAKLQVNCDAAKNTLDAKTAERDAAGKAADEARQKALQHKTRAEELDAKAKELAREIEQGTQLLTEADAVAELEIKLKNYPNNLDALIADAVTEEGNTDETVRTATAAKTRADALLSRAKEEQTRFAGVKSGVPCPHCRQPVDESHTATIRSELADKAQQLQGELDDATRSADTASDRLTTARTKRKKLEKQKAERDKLVVQRDTRRDSLNALGVVADAVELRTQLAEKGMQKDAAVRDRDAEKVLHQAAIADAAKLDKERTRLEAEVKAEDRTSKMHEKELATATGQEKTTFIQLSDDWKARLPSTDVAAVAELASDRNRLITEKVAEKFKALEQDDALREEWQKQHAGVIAEINSIHKDDRISEADAKQQQAMAKLHADEADTNHNAAANQRDELARRKRQHDQLTGDYRDAEEWHRLHDKLDRLLGQTGLQRELVRDAEEQIVAFASETLQHLSEGNLLLEEDTTPDSTKTFDLRVRRGGGEPIGVAFLSGSQRFRVAVSIALAVGRFASGRTRPLEAVIIDEGFGSLDPEGLQAMAGELKRLQQAKSLRRVVLVSHQPEFTEQFAVGYTLTAGENGTIATPFRR